MPSLLRWSAPAAALQLFLIAAVAHSAPGLTVETPKGCSPTNVALFEAPTPGCGSTLNATVGTPLTFSVKAADADAGDMVTLDVIGLPAGAQLSTALPAIGNPASTDFTWTPAAGDTGSHVVTFTAFDGCAAGPTQCAFTVKVSAAATCSSAHVALFEAPTPGCGSTLNATVGTPFTFTVNAVDADAGDVVQLGVIDLPAGAQLSTALPASGNPVSTVFTWTPAAGDTGSHVVTFTAFDGCAAGPTQCAFTVKVAAAATCSSAHVALFEAPTPGCGSTLNATVGTPFTFTVNAVDADAGDVVQLGVIDLPAGAQLSTALPASGNPVSTVFTWTPAAGDTGSHVVTFTAFDGCAAGPTQCSFTVKVSGGAACSSAHVALFESPTPGCGSTLHATVGAPFTFTVNAADADAGDVVQLGVIGLPAGAQLSTALPASGNPVSTVFTWTPAASDTGSHVVTFTAFDGCAAGPTQCSFTVSVTGGGAACSPAHVALFESPSPGCGSTLHATVGAPFTFTVNAADADVGDVVQLGVIGLPTGAHLSTALPASGNPVSTVFTWTPAASDTGSHVVTFTAFDGCAAGPTQCSFTVSVTGGGAACSPAHVALFESPSPGCGSTLHATVGAPFTFTVNAADADVGDVVQLGVIGLPTGAHLSTALPASGNPVSTVFTWTPAASDTGSHVVTFTAFDGCAAGPTQCSFTVQVIGGGPPPDCSGAFVADSKIWPPNGRMVPVHIQGIGDPGGEPFTVRVTNITQDEPVGKGDDSGDGSCDATIDKNGNASVRARRNGNGDGRVYHVTFVATASGGASCEGSVELCVPHDQGRHNDCVDSGQNYHVDSACFAEAGGGGGGGGGCTPTNVALFQSPTPGCGSTLSATVGTPLTFTVNAGDADAGDVVQLGVIDLPAGAQLSTALPASGNPISTNFSWTPAAADTGSHVITFTAFDGCAAGPTRCSFTVNVSHAQNGIDLKVTQLSAGVAQVQYTLPTEAQVSLAVYNVAGRRIATILEGRQPAGTRTAQWVVTNPLRTIYFVQLRSGDQSISKRIFFLNR